MQKEKRTTVRPTPLIFQKIEQKQKRKKASLAISCNASIDVIDRTTKRQE